MQCPFGEEVGGPPSITRCPRGFPGCACADEWLLDQTEPNDQSRTVMAWWDDRGGL